MKVHYAPAKRTLTNLKWRLTLLLVLSPFLYFGGKMIFSLFVAPSSGFVMLDIQHYQCPVAATVQKIDVEIGQHVQVGDLLVTLQDLELDSELVRLRTTRADILAGPDPDAISGDFLRKQKQLAEEAVAFQKKRTANVSYLFNRGAATLAEERAAFSQLNGALLQLNNAEFELKRWSVRQQLSLEELKERPEYRDLSTRIELLEAEQQRLQVRATYPGQVTEINITQGQALQPGGDMVTVAHQDRQIVAAFIPPGELERVKRGEMADIVFPSGKVIPGRVQYNPRITGRLPAYLATPMLGRQRMVVVHLVPVVAIPEEESIDGLPVDVNFMTPMQQFIDKLQQVFTLSR